MARFALQTVLSPYTRQTSQRIVDEALIFRIVEPAADAGRVRQGNNGPVFLFERFADDLPERFLAEEPAGSEPAEGDDDLWLDEGEFPFQVRATEPDLGG